MEIVLGEYCIWKSLVEGESVDLHVHIKPQVEVVKGCITKNCWL